jgi:CxxC motif-containing protein (DUF1111 family)
MSSTLVIQLSIEPNPTNQDFEQVMKQLGFIPEQQITSNTYPDDINKEGISGKANWVLDDISRTTKLERFGWKAGKPNLDQQNLAALLTDIGVSSWLYPQAEGDCTLAQSHCTQLAKNTETQIVKAIGNSTLDNGTLKSSLWVEASKDMTDLLLLFTATMDQKNRPTQTQFELEAVKPGRELFNQIGCQNCHISAYRNITDT